MHYIYVCKNYAKSTKVEVIRRALALYNYVNKEVKEKDLKLAVTNEDDKVIKEIVLDL